MTVPATDRWKPNVTVAAVASRTRVDGAVEYLMVEEDTRAGRVLNNPAGHLDASESLLAAVCREALEETARVFEPTHVVGVYLMSPARSDGRDTGDDDGVTWLRFAVAGHVGEPELGRTLDEPVVRTHWMTLDELRACPERHRSALVLRTLEDHAAGRSAPLDLLHHLLSDASAG